MDGRGGDLGVLVGSSRAQLELTGVETIRSTVRIPVGS
jgi:hypothetical protein